MIYIFYQQKNNNDLSAIKINKNKNDILIKIY